METIKELEELLSEVTTISKKYDEIAKTSGENFNIFSIMSMEWNEVYTHSAIIGELLNPEGTHGQGDVFLNFFRGLLNKKFELSIKEFGKLVDAKICERTISISNDWDKVEGGRIDIVIEDEKQIIVIENKPSAKDQAYQLIRYYNYAKQRNKTFYIIYLTLDDKKLADEKPYKNGIQDISGKNFSYFEKGKYEEYKMKHLNTTNFFCLYHQITFEHDIIEWLEECINHTESIPLISQTLVQYLNNVKNITGKTTNNKMSEEIKNLINVGNVDAIEELHNSLILIRNKTIQKLRDALGCKIVTDTIEVGDGTVTCGQYHDGGYYLGFQYYNNENLNHSEKSTKVFEEITKKWPDLVKGNNKDFLLWYVPKPFELHKPFENLDSKILVEMYLKNEYFEKVVIDVEIEFNNIKEFIINFLKKDV